MQKTAENFTALLSIETDCPCQSGNTYQDCCAPFHQFYQYPANAEQLMRSRYTAFVLQQIDYIVKTTAPLQQKRLNVEALANWAAETQWLGLNIQKYIPHLSKIHSAVEFEAFFNTPEGRQTHREYSLFVTIEKRWYFVDPTVDLPTMKQACLCGSGKKFKHCCGAYL
ncbi:MAG: YchJ family protein [Lonepinella koalarum]|nr:YchJ family protein [Lonepinella koalarum]